MSNSTSCGICNEYLLWCVSLCFGYGGNSFYVTRQDPLDLNNTIQFKMWVIVYCLKIGTPNVSKMKQWKMFVGLILTCTILSIVFDIYISFHQVICVDYHFDSNFVISRYWNDDDVDIVLCFCGYHNNNSSLSSFWKYCVYGESFYTPSLSHSTEHAVFCRRHKQRMSQ